MWNYDPLDGLEMPVIQPRRPMLNRAAYGQPRQQAYRAPVDQSSYAKPGYTNQVVDPARPFKPQMQTPDTLNPRHQQQPVIERQPPRWR